MARPKRLRAIFFDAAGTLFHLPRGVGWHYRHVALRHDLDLEENALNRAFRMAWKRATPLPTTRVVRSDDDRSWWRALVDDVLESCGVSPAFDRATFFEDLYTEFAKPGVWERYPEVSEVLEHVAGKFTVGIISNFDGRLRIILDQLGIASHFEHLAISSEVGADKPDPWIFEHALASAGITAAEAIHVGDDPACDWEGAAAVGMRTFRLDRPNNSLRDLLSVLDDK